MKTRFLSIILLIVTIGYSQGSSNISNAVNTPQSVANPPRLIGAQPIPLGTWQVYIKDDIRWETYNINNFNSQVVTVTAGVYKPIGYSPTSLEITNSLGYIPYNSANPNGYISSYIETDPVWSSVASLYRTKTQNDLLYVSLTGSYSNPSWITSLDYSKLTGTPTIPSAQVNSDWNSVSGVSQILNKPVLSTVAISGVYADLSGKPIIPTDNNQLTNGSGYITSSSTNTLTNKSGNISQWTNDSGYLTGITSTQINTALGYTAYNGTTNPNGFLTSINSSQVISALGYTPVTNARTLTINGTTFDLSTNRTWIVGDVTTANLTAGLATKENTITAGTTAQYWRGDKTWQTLDKTAVGLSNVDNTADANKNVLSATKLTTARNINGVAFDGTANIIVADATKEPIITAGTNLQYWRGDKTWQTLNTTAVPEGTNLYYTDARARSSISLTTTGSGAATYSGGVLNIPTNTGTVTSVGITGSDFNISGSPVTSSGNISLALSTTGVSAGTYGRVTVDTKGRTTAGKAQVPYIGVTDASGNYTVSFGVTYATVPNIMVTLINPNVRDTPLPVVTTTGFTVNVQRRTDVIGLLPSYANVVGGAVHVLVTEN